MRCDWCGRRLKNPATPYEGFALGPVCLRRVKGIDAAHEQSLENLKQLGVVETTEPSTEPGSLSGSVPQCERPLDDAELAFVRSQIEVIREFERRHGRVTSAADHVASRLLATLDYALHHPEGTEC